MVGSWGKRTVWWNVHYSKFCPGSLKSGKSGSQKSRVYCIYIYLFVYLFICHIFSISLNTTVFQTCISANRVLVQAGVYEQFLALLKETMQQRLMVGDGMDDGVNIGPLINTSQLKKVSE